MRPHLQALEWLTLTRIANIEDATFDLLLDARERRLQRQAQAGLDSGAALDDRSHDLERLVIDLAEKGGPAIERLDQA